MNHQLKVVLHHGVRIDNEGKQFLVLLTILAGILSATCYEDHTPPFPRVIL